MNTGVADSKVLLIPPCFLCKISSTNLSPFLDSRKLNELEGRSGEESGVQEQVGYGRKETPIPVAPG